MSTKLYPIYRARVDVLESHSRSLEKFLGIPRKRVGISVDPPLPRLDVLDYSQGLDQIVLGGARLLVKGVRITDANIQRNLIIGPEYIYRTRGPLAKEKGSCGAFFVADESVPVVECCEEGLAIAFEPSLTREASKTDAPDLILTVFTSRGHAVTRTSATLNHFFRGRPPRAICVAGVGAGNFFGPVVAVCEGVGTQPSDVKFVSRERCTATFKSF